MARSRSLCAVALSDVPITENRLWSSASSRALDVAARAAPEVAAGDDPGRNSARAQTAVATTMISAIRNLPLREMCCVVPVDASFVLFIEVSLCECMSLFDFPARLDCQHYITTRTEAHRHRCRIAGLIGDPRKEESD